MYKRICIFGDSITWGAIDTKSGGWVERLKIEMFKQDRLKDILNCGISADTTENLLLRFESEAKSRRTDALVFAIGINDSSFLADKKRHHVPIDQFRKNLQLIIDKAQLITPEITFIGLTKVIESFTTPVEWIQTVFYKNEWILVYDNVILDSCKNNGVRYITMFDLLDDAELPDGLHPGPIGHQKMFERVLSHLNLDND